MSTPQRPRLIVFDLDNTLWTPELYQLKRTPKAGKDIWLFEDVQEILFELASDKVTWGNTRVAIASRTNKVDWAHGSKIPLFVSSKVSQSCYRIPCQYLTVIGTRRTACETRITARHRRGAAISVWLKGQRVLRYGASTLQRDAAARRAQLSCRGSRRRRA